MFKKANTFFNSEYAFLHKNLKILLNKHLEIWIMYVIKNVFDSYILRRFKNMYSLFGSPLVAGGKKEDGEKKWPLITIVLQSTEDFYKPY